MKPYGPSPNSRDAVLHDDGEMLVAAEMHGPRAADFFERAIARRLRPAVAIEVGEQAIVALAVHVDGAAEGGLREHGLHLRAGPVLRPVAEEFLLPLAEQLQARQVDRLRIVGGIVDVVGTRPHLRNLARRAALEFAVFENGEVHAADVQPREIDA